MIVTWKGDKIFVELNGVRESLVYYWNKDAFFVFDFNGNCFRTLNTIDLIQKATEQAVDTERILSPMSGMVVSIRATENKKFKKVKNFKFLIFRAT